MSYINVIIARIVPFHCWSIIKSVKSNERYLVGSTGLFLVNYIGKTESLSHDFNVIINKLGLAVEMEPVERMNMSSHKNVSAYFDRNWHLALINRNYSRELRICKLVQSKPVDFNYRGLNLYHLLSEFD